MQEAPLDTKPLPQFSGDVFELRGRFDSNVYRLMYVVALQKAVYVLHAFMKKSKSGIGLLKERALTQQEAARLCGTDQATFSKVLRGRMESITIDQLAAWLNALGHTVEIHVRPYDREATSGQLVIAPLTTS